MHFIANARVSWSVTGSSVVNAHNGPHPQPLSPGEGGVNLPPLSPGEGLGVRAIVSSQRTLATFHKKCCCARTG
jgi:hypothetical protein